jgi:putative transposase
MKVAVEIDCTPEEARQFMGLPDLQPMQAAVMAEMEKRVLADDLTGWLWTGLIERSARTRGVRDEARTEAERGAGGADAAPDRSSDGARQKHRRRVQGGGRLRAKLQDECLKQEIFYSLKEAQIVIGLWQNTYNRVRPHSSLGYRPPAPVSFPDLAFRLPMAAIMQ